MVSGTNNALISFRARALRARARSGSKGCTGCYQDFGGRESELGRIWNSRQFEGVQAAAGSSLRPDRNSESVCRRIPRIR